MTSSAQLYAFLIVMLFDLFSCYRGRKLAETIQHLENFIEYENYDPDNADQSKLRYVLSKMSLVCFLLCCGHPVADMSGF